MADEQQTAEAESAAVDDVFSVVPDGWVWTLTDVECSSCGAAAQLHEQPPEWLAAGVKWECPTCGAANRLGGSEPLPAADHVLECGACHATFDPNVVPADDEGRYVCPACQVPNRYVGGGEHVSVIDDGSV